MADRAFLKWRERYEQRQAKLRRRAAKSHASRQWPMRISSYGVTVMARNRSEADLVIRLFEVGDMLNLQSFIRPSVPAEGDR